MFVKVKQATIKAGLFLSYKYDLTGNDVTNAISTSSDAPIHDDLRTAFRNLTPFFVHRCEEINDENLIEAAIHEPDKHLLKHEYDDPEGKNPLLRYKVTGFTISGKNDGESVLISGHKVLADGNTVSFNTPFTKQDSDYKFVGELFDAVEVCKQEVNDYMNGKQAPSNQLSLLGSLEDDEEGDDI